jgi:hypothetical protein
VESPRGWKISKAVQTHKIDIVIALGLACLGAVGSASKKPPMVIHEDVLQRSARLVTRPHYGDMYAFDATRLRAGRWGRY